MKVDTYKDGRKIINVRDLKELEKSKVPISIKTSTKVRKFIRYCDRYSTQMVRLSVYTEGISLTMIQSYAL